MKNAVFIIFLAIALVGSAFAKPEPKADSKKGSSQTEVVKKAEKNKTEKSKTEKKKVAQKDKPKKEKKAPKDKKPTKTAKKAAQKVAQKPTKKTAQKATQKPIKEAKDSKNTEETQELLEEDIVLGENDSKTIAIKSDDPKAFTKALLYEKQGVEVEIVDKSGKKKKPEPPEEFFDFSTMLIPVTHEARLGSPYGIRDHRLHRGVDIQVEKGEPMVAAYPGEVIVSKYNKGGYGHYVLVQHANGLQTLYGHLAERSVKVGEQVFPGDIVGLAGNTGKSSGAHLHFEIRYGEVNIDPATVIDFPHWQLKPGVEKFSKKKAILAHRKMQSKLKVENVYVVKSGDTVADVAAFFYISEDAVRRINRLGKDQALKVGQKLKGCM